MKQESYDAFKQLDGETVCITGKVTKMEYGSVLERGAGKQNYYFEPNMHLGNNEMTSDVQVSASAMTCNKFMLQNHIEEGDIIKAYGTASASFWGFNLTVCYHMDLLDENGNLITYWDASIAFADLPY